MQDDRRHHLLKHIAVVLEQQLAEFSDVVRDEIDLDRLGFIHHFVSEIRLGKSDHFPHRRDVCAAKIVIGIGGVEPVEMRTADRDEKQGMRVRREGVVDDLFVDIHDCARVRATKLFRD